MTVTVSMVLPRPWSCSLRNSCVPSAIWNTWQITPNSPGHTLPLAVHTVTRPWPLPLIARRTHTGRHINTSNTHTDGFSEDHMYPCIHPKSLSVTHTHPHLMLHFLLFMIHVGWCSLITPVFTNSAWHLWLILPILNGVEGGYEGLPA